MSPTYLTYKPINGFIHNWLVAGPQVTPLTIDHADASIDFIRSFFRDCYQPDHGITLPPVDLGALYPESPSPTWRYYRCRNDHLIDLTALYSQLAHLCSWAYVQIEIDSACEVDLILSTNCAADLWLNGSHLHRQEIIQKTSLESRAIPAMLETGRNELLLRFEGLALPAAPYAIALRVTGAADEALSLHIPTNIEPRFRERRLAQEEVAYKAYLDSYIYGHHYGDRYNKNQPLTLRFSDDLESTAEIIYRLQSLDGHIYQEGFKSCSRDTVIEMARDFPLFNGPHNLALLPHAEDYYVKKLRFERLEPFHIVRTPYSPLPYGTIESRKKEALEDALGRRDAGVYGEIARAALQKWSKIDRKNLEEAVGRIQERQNGSISDLLGMLGLVLRFGRKKGFPKGLRATVKSCIQDYRYWQDEPGSDLMDFQTESQQILFHTCEILAGQLLPERIFKNNGKPGKWHKEHGEDLALTWMRQRGMYGFQDWDSPAGFDEMLTALSHLVDLAETPAIADLASVLMDKLFFTLALNSFHGAFGSTRGRTDTPSLLSARLEPTSGIARLMWGMGNFNEHVMGVVSLACCQNYELPEVIQKIAQEPASAVWSRASHGVVPASDASPTGTIPQVSTVAYKTRDFLLSSAQSYRPGSSGRQEHIWQATLGPDAVVFTNHPTCMSEADDHQPNLWKGNGCLPRVAQWGDLLVAIYKLPQDDWLGFTHAYFPAVAFNEYTLQAGWAFARRGDGYIGLWAAKGLEFITHGQTAYRELRSYGNDNLWVCHMGQRLLDGDFLNFQQKILGMEKTYAALSIRLRSLRGDSLSFAWSDPLVVNGGEQPLSGFSHYESPYCLADYPASQMDILYEEGGLHSGIRLKFA